MSFEDKAKGLKDQVSGKVKEVAGDVTGNEKLEAEGKTEGLLGKAKEALGDAKDAVADKVSDVTDAVSEKFNDVVDGIKKDDK